MTDGEPPHRRGGEGGQTGGSGRGTGGQGRGSTGGRGQGSTGGRGQGSTGGRGQGSAAGQGQGRAAGQAGGRAAGTAANQGGQRQVPILALDNVVKRYRTGRKVLTALKGVNFQVHSGEFVTIMGPSGSGKTTMLNILGLLDRPSEGKVYFTGHDVTDFTDQQRTRQRRQTIGFVFQDFYLLESLTARENVEIPSLFAGGGGVASERAEHLLDIVGLGDRTGHYPNELSGGQKQRVAIARSLINEPQVVLADEPTGNLDHETSIQILDVLSRVCTTGAAVVAVTHDPLVADYAERRIDVANGHVTARTHTPGR